MAPAIQPRQTLLFIGDSITFANYPTQSPPLGDGYVRLIAELFDARYPAHQLRYINRGIGGNTIRDLQNRWEQDVYAHQPDWLTIKIGVNDLWCWLIGRQGKSVSPEQYAEIYDQLLTDTRRRLPRTQIVLVDSFFISTDFEAQNDRGRMLRWLPRYLRVVEQMAQKHGTRHVRTHAAFHELLQHVTPDRLCPEPVHPHLAGHTVIATKWLESVGW